MDEFWPGPISFILPLKQGYLCSKVTGGLESIAVRMPSHKIGRALLQIVDEPIAALVLILVVDRHQQLLNM